MARRPRGHGGVRGLGWLPIQSALCSHCVHTLSFVFVVDREVLVANAGALEERDAAERRRCQREGAWPDRAGQCRIASWQYHRREPEQQSPEKWRKHAEQSSQPCAHKVAFRCESRKPALAGKMPHHRLPLLIAPSPKPQRTTYDRSGSRSRAPLCGLTASVASVPCFTSIVSRGMPPSTTANRLSEPT